MSEASELEFFKNRKEGKTYISKLFTYGAHDDEGIRQVRMVIDGGDQLHFGEIEGAMCLRLTGKVRKTQITAIVSQDDKKIKRVTLETFRNRKSDGGWIEAFEKDEFTFRSDEFSRLIDFLKRIKFIDLTNEEKFQIEDVSKTEGPKAIVDVTDREIFNGIKSMGKAQRDSLMGALRGSLTSEEINILLGRKQALNEYKTHIRKGDWDEKGWQDFFDREQWVFGYGLDYRIMGLFDRELTVGGGGTDNQNKPVIDFLMTFTDYTVLVEIKKPDTPIFRQRRGGRAGTWQFSADFVDAVSQILEQKARWASFSQSASKHHNKSGTKTLEARTRNAKCILVIGSSSEFERAGNNRDNEVMRDTFELFRRENRSIDIVTFDELLDRARFITSEQPKERG